ncbi:hypothetical protein [Paenibacillus sp. KS1]|nr:hypothetical protein [Paenibacillus sp. KS1]
MRQVSSSELALFAVQTGKSIVASFIGLPPLREFQPSSHRPRFKKQGEM